MNKCPSAMQKHSIISFRWNCHTKKKHLFDFTFEGNGFAQVHFIYAFHLQQPNGTRLNLYPFKTKYDTVSFDFCHPHICVIFNVCCRFSHPLVILNNQIELHRFGFLYRHLMEQQNGKNARKYPISR